MADSHDNSFWDFSLTVYARENVERACLALQERHDLDINMLLFCCWAGSRGRSLTAADIGRLRDAVEPWRSSVVTPLRGVRGWLKTQGVAAKSLTDPLRERIKADELDAEAVAQRLMVETVPVNDGTGEPDLAAANLTTYFAELGLAAGDRDTADLATLLRGCFAGLRPAEAEQLLAR